MKKSHNVIYASLFIVLFCLIGIIIFEVYLGDATVVPYKRYAGVSGDSDVEQQENNLVIEYVGEEQGKFEEAQEITVTVVDSSDDAGSGSILPIADAQASSVYSGDQYNHSAWQACDGDLASSWQEGEQGSGKGSWLKFELDGAHSVTGIVFYLGVWHEVEGKDYYHGNYRPKEIEISIGDYTILAEFSDNKVPHLVTFSSPVEASEIQFTVLDVYGDGTYDETGISEIQILE